MSGWNLSELAVKERAITLFLIIAIALSGIFAYRWMGRAEDPGFTLKIMQVYAAWPGATAWEMQEQVAEKLEKRLEELRYFDVVETICRPGFVYITVLLKETMPPAEVPEQFYQVRKKLSDEIPNLPKGVLGPYFNDDFNEVQFALYSLEAPDLEQRDVVRIAESLRTQLLQQPGVKRVNLYGEQTEKFYLEISSKRLATLGLSASDIFEALQEANTVTPAGELETAASKIYLRPESGVNTVEAIRQVALVAGGRSFTVGDIGDVKHGYEDPPTYRIRHFGAPALMLGVVMKDAWNGLVLGETLAKWHRETLASLPLGANLTKISDRSRFIVEAVDEFTFKFFVALGVVMLVSFFTLGWRGGIIVGAAVPLTLSCTLVIMYFTGRDLDRISLGALIIALGLLVDDAIIAIEMMAVKMEEGFDRVKAATYAWTATAAPMLSGTLVTCAGFTPIGFAKSVAGEYAGNIFWVVTFALIASWFIAVVVTPYLGVKLLPDIRPVHGGRDAIYATPTYVWLRGQVQRCVNYRKCVVLFTVGAFLLSVLALIATQKQFFPTSDRPEVMVEVYMPYGTAIGVTEKVVQELEEVLAGEPETEGITSYVGGGAPRFFLAYAPETPDPAFARLIVVAKDAHQRTALINRMREKIAHGLLPQARIRFSALLFGPPVVTPVGFRILGPDLNKIRSIAAEVVEILASHPDLRDVHMQWGERVPTVHIALDQERLRLIGLSPKDAADQLQFLMNGVPVTQIREDIRTVDLVVRAPLSERRNLTELGSLILMTKDERAVSLDQIGTLEVRMEDPILKRRKREPYILALADIAEGLQPPDVTASVLPLLDPVKARLPEGYRIVTAGSVEEAGKANDALFAVFPIMMILMLGIIIVQVRSFSAMFMVFATAPLGLVGAAPALLIFQKPFGFTAILGLIGLAGIIMRNTLILVQQIKEDKARGLNDYDAVVEATVRRSRPVVLTALAAALAFIPLTLSTFWGPLAYVLIGGVTAGTALTLLFLPALYSLWFRVKTPG